MHRGETAEQVILTESEAERVVHELCAIDHESAWTRILEVGRVVFEGLGGGDEAQWRSRRGTKHLSLRRLVEHPACPFKKTALGDAVNLHLFVKHNPWVLELTGLTPTHVLRVVGLPTERALDLLRAAAENGWTVRELGSHVQSLRDDAGDGGRRPTAQASWEPGTLARRAVTALREMHGSLARCEPIDDRQSSLLLSTLDELSELLAQTWNLPAVGRRSGVVLALAKPARIDEPQDEPVAVGAPAPRSVPGRR